VPEKKTTIKQETMAKTNKIFLIRAIDANFIRTQCADCLERLNHRPCDAFDMN